jgi:hypothetical protein
MKLRMLIILQIVCVAFIGAACWRIPDVVFSGRWVGPVEELAGLALFPALIGFPILVYRAVRRSGLPTWKRWMIAGIEAALAYATSLAILPAVQ